MEYTEVYNIFLVDLGAVFSGHEGDAAELLREGMLKVYKDLPHGMPATHADIINADVLAFVEG